MKWFLLNFDIYTTVIFVPSPSQTSLHNYLPTYVEDFIILSPQVTHYYVVKKQYLQRMIGEILTLNIGADTKLIWLDQIGFTYFEYMSEW